jgi:hypothetical protein
MSQERATITVGHGITVDAMLYDQDREDRLTGPSPLQLPVRISIRAGCISLHFPGFGDNASTDAAGEPFHIEYSKGIPRVIVFGNINQEEPTHVISLTAAKLSDRKDDGS